MKAHFILIAVLGIIGDVLCDEDLVVETAEGKLQGKSLTSRNGRTYSAFLGIPYAKPPERFEAPEVPLPWSGIRNATEFGSICVQDTWIFDLAETVDGSEDCLFLNVYTPNIKSEKKLPVMLFLHGGAYNMGNGNTYGAKYLLDHDVVLVTINYRLGAFGFLNTGDGLVSGNMGMKDQVMALKWTQKNIEKFGGDSKKVTLFGESAGGASAVFHMASPMSKGLFHRVIAQSGSSLCKWTTVSKPTYFMERLAVKLNCPTGSTKEIVDCLKSKDAHEIGKQHFRRYYLESLFPFGPSVESVGENANSEVFLAENSLGTLKRGEFTKVPILMGIQEHEGLLFYAAPILSSAKMTKELDKDWDNVAPIILHYDKEEQSYTDSEEKEMSSKIRKFYFEDKAVGLTTGRSLVDLCSDRWFVHCVRSAAMLLAKAGDKESPVYTYINKYRGKASILDYLGVTNRTGVLAGNTHADELQFLFNTDYFPQPLDKEAEEFSKTLVKVWTDFAANGKLEINGKEMKPIDPNQEPHWYELGVESGKLLESPFNSRMKFWDEMLGYNFSSKTEL